jgi:uncharacterized membrane protein
MRETTVVALMIAGVFVLLIAGAIASASLPAESGWRLPFRLLCHGIEQRCLTVGEGRMAVCSRCFGIYAGAVAGIGLWLLIRKRVPVAFVMLLAAPLLVDGATQALGLRESTNVLRLATGVPAGAALLFLALQWLETPRLSITSASADESGQKGVKP